jgi:pyruvate dehydrogenase complex dehydrogenase (E1) component
LPHATRLLAGSDAPVIAVSDYVRAVPDAIRAYVPRERPYTVLGTDGFGRSDTRARCALLRGRRASIAHAALHALHGQGRSTMGRCAGRGRGWRAASALGPVSGGADPDGRGARSDAQVEQL